MKEFGPGVDATHASGDVLATLDVAGATDQPAATDGRAQTLSIAGP